MLCRTSVYIDRILRQDKNYINGYFSSKLDQEESRQETFQTFSWYVLTIPMEKKKITVQLFYESACVWYSTCFADHVSRISVEATSQSTSILHC